MRNATETRERVLKQMDKFEAGENIAPLQTKTGVKDSSVTYWQNMEKEQENAIDADIIQGDWPGFDVVPVIQTPDTRLSKINPFLTLEGVCVLRSKSAHVHDNCLRLRSEHGQSSGDLAYCSPWSSEVCLEYGM